MLQDLLAPFWFLNAHIFYRYMYINSAKPKTAAPGYLKRKRVHYYSCHYIHKYMCKEFKEYVAYYQNNIKVLSGLKFYAHLN